MQINELISQAKIDRGEAELLLGHVLKQDQVYLRIHGDKTVTPSAAEKFVALVKRRLKHEPIAYLIKSQPFMGQEFIVDRNVLIPRPETEILAQLVIQHLKKLTWDVGRRTCDVIVDVGTGSGCLAITLALAFPKATVIASDISTKALAIAKQNAKKLKANVKFVKSNLLGLKLLSVIPASSFVIPAQAGIQKNKQKQNRMDPRIRKDDNVILVANLPYLPSSDKKTMMPDVAKYEPAKALFAGADGSMLVRKLLTQVHSFFRHSEWSAAEPKNPTKPSNQLISSVRSFDYVRPTHSAQACPERSRRDDISVFLEIDPPQAKELSSFAKKLFPNKKVQIKKDLCGLERFLIISYNKSLN